MTTKPKPTVRMSRPQVPIFAHSSDPPDPYRLASVLGRAVALELMDWDDAADALTVSALTQLRKRGAPFDPLGLHARLSWALLDAAERIDQAGEGFVGRLALVLAARLRAMSTELTGGQRQRALADLEVLADSTFRQAGRPLRADMIGPAFADAMRLASRRVARERAA
jgi:hypothetical protein